VPLAPKFVNRSSMLPEITRDAFVAAGTGLAHDSGSARTPVKARSVEHSVARLLIRVLTCFARATGKQASLQNRDLQGFYAKGIGPRLGHDTARRA
jgi:hypothetical protein